MAELPRFDNATEKVEQVAHKAKRDLLWWLPDPMPCDECGRVCEPSWAYDPQTAAFHAETNGQVKTWYCEHCDIHYRRGDPYE